MSDLTTRAEMRLPSVDLTGDMNFFIQKLGFRLDMIFPADDPRVVTVSGHGLRIRLQRGAAEGPGTVRILAEDPASVADGAIELTAPNGTRIEIARLHPPLEIPGAEHGFVVRQMRDEAPWVIGRAGMHYRDLIPERLGGSIIASHIRIPGGGPVPDMVHYHTIGFQLIFCYRGWVDVLYEDQGPAIRLSAGDCVTQPPGIRHRVMHASDNLEVIEIGVPAEHITTVEHDMELPNGHGDPAREWDGQRFVHHLAAEAEWTGWRVPGFERRDTGINDGTKGLASVQVVRRTSGECPPWSHDGDILFDFVMDGTMVLSAEGKEPVRLAAGDAFTVSPGLEVAFSDCSDDLEILEAALPGRFTTTLAGRWRGAGRLSEDCRR